MTFNQGFERRFENWRRWCLMNGRFQAKAGSAEGNYRSGQVWEDVQPRPRWLIELNVPDAVEVNRVYVSLSYWDRRVIKVLWFRTHWKPQWQGQKLGVHYTKLEEIGTKSLENLRMRLDKPVSGYRMTSTVSAVLSPLGAIDV
jgi:hypothetical protein